MRVAFTMPSLRCIMRFIQRNMQKMDKLMMGLMLLFSLCLLGPREVQTFLGPVVCRLG